MDFLTIMELLPVLTILLILVLKIYFPKKFNPALFWSIMVICLLCSGALIYTLATITTLNNPVWYRLVNDTVGTYFLTSLPFIAGASIILFVIILTGSLIYKFKTKDEEINKKLAISLPLLFVVFILSFPGLICPVDIYIPKDSLQGYEKTKLASDLSLIPGIKGKYAMFAADYMFSYIYDNHKNDYSSEETKKYIDEYIKYKHLYTKLLDSNDYISLSKSCINYKYYDKAIEFGHKINEIGLNGDGLISEAYAKKGDFDKAVEFANKTIVPEFYISKIYIMQNDFDKALEETEKLNKEKTFYNSRLCEIYYKTGKTKQAEEQFNIIKEKTKNWDSDISFEDYIKIIEDRF